MRYPTRLFPSLLSLLGLVMLAAGPAAWSQQSALSERDLEHQSPEWATVQAHLPDPKTASADRLETEGDVLRARRFPEDAIDYYEYALKRGGPPARLMKKIGVTHLELHRITTAQIYFQRATKLNKRDAEAWNNLAAVEYLQQRYGTAVRDYKRAVKLEKTSAIFHSNLGIAYFDRKDYENSGREIRIALRLDPKVFEDAGTTGVSAHVLTSQDRARFCFEMAKAYARIGNEAEMLRSLGIASEGGIDILDEMKKDVNLAKYAKDERVLIIVQNTKALRTSNAAMASAAGAVPTLPAHAE
jgi:tetratricopeptide (TPR) repeat protein